MLTHGAATLHFYYYKLAFVTVWGEESPCGIPIIGCATPYQKK